MPVKQLLALLNERLLADVGDDVAPYTMDQLRTEIDTLRANRAGAGWSSVRKMLNEARRHGVLDEIDEQVINDFAVVFTLNAKQVLHLKDVILAARAKP